jgi:hypothetical protein
MSIIKDFKNLGRLAVLGAAVVAAVPLTAAPSPAQAQRWHGYHGGYGWHGGHGWRGGYWRHRDNGSGIALGLIGGALAGAAIASAANPYGYYYPYYSYSYPYPYSYGYTYPYYYGYGY